MADVFVSYARTDAALARKIAQTLKTAGYEVWWDSELLPHHVFAQSIEQEVRAAKAVLVVWSEHAVNSQWVRAEADLARSQGKLVQIAVDHCAIPLPFNQYQTADLRHWNGDSSDPQWMKVLASIAQLTSRAAAPVAAGTKTPGRFNALGGKALSAMGERRSPAVFVAIVLVAVLVAASAAGGLWFVRTAFQPPARGARIAVQPFEAIGGAPALRDFAAGLSESLEDTLNQDQLQTLSRSDAETLHGADLPARLKALNVGLLFSGTVQAAADTVTVRTHLEDPVQHATLWSADISGPSAQLEPLQAQIGARTVAVLNCSAQALRQKGGIADAEVLALFLHACDLAETSDHGGSDDKLAYAMLDAMREVARQAPDFAPAHSILSKHDAYLADGLRGQSQSLRKEAEQEARRALQIDPKDPDGFVTFGLLAPRLDYGQRARFFRQAIATDPSWPHANGFLGNVMSDIGRLDEALTLYQRAASANPQSLDWSDMVAVGLVRDGQAKKADEELARLNQLWPNRASLWETQLSSLIAQHRWPNALKLLNDVDGHQDTSGFPMKRYRAELSALTTHDPKAMAEARQQALLVAADNPQGAMNGLAFLGLIDDAFAIAQRYSPIRPDGVETPGFLFGPMTAALRRDPRFMTLANKFGLTQYWRSTGKWPDFCSDANLPYNCQQAAAKLTPIVAH